MAIRIGSARAFNVATSSMIRRGSTSLTFRPPSNDGFLLDGSTIPQRLTKVRRSSYFERAKPNILIYRYTSPPGGIMNVERLAKIIATAAIAVTPALTAVAGTAAPAAAAGIHAAGPASVTGATSIIE